MKAKNILNKKLYYLILLVLTLIAATISSDLQQVVQHRFFVTEPSPETSEEATPSATPVAGHGGKIVTVVDVVDGDTIKVSGGEIVRYIGMNTPETVAPGRPIECYGKEASTKNNELVRGQTVELEKDISNRDKYGRLLRYVWVGDRLINEELVREGYALVSTYPPDVKYESRLLAAERQARQEGKGLWGSVCSRSVLRQDNVSPVTESGSLTSPSGEL